MWELLLGFHTIAKWHAERRLETADGFEAHLGTNYLGAFLLTVMILPALQRGVRTRSDKS